MSMSFQLIGIGEWLGDAFTAGKAIGLLSGWDLDTINERSNAVLAAVAAQGGSTPVLPGGNPGFIPGPTVRLTSRARPIALR